MEKAAQAGYLTPPERDSTVTVLRDLSEQAIDKYNLTNTQMLQSSVAQYAKAVNLTAQEYARLTARAEATQGILNEAAASVASGTETRLTAVRRALTRISDEGLTGFIDKAGRSWSPEAYVNMVTRTTVHNVAVQSVQARMQDYNAQVFQVSAHAGARPLCYPYQGKLYSWDNTAGEIEAGDGKVWRYAPLRETSYGQPAGLFGINCGHSPIPVIPGVSIPHAQDFVQPKEENDKAYAESQEQRELERKIREAKRVVEMAGNAATKEDKAKVRELQKQMREFIDRTGRTRRYDREQIGGDPNKLLQKKTDDGKVRSKMAETGGRRNEDPLTEEQKARAEKAARAQGYPGDIDFSDYVETSIVIYDDSASLLVIGTDAYPRGNPRNANEALSVEASMAHEVVGHYEARLRGTRKDVRLLEEAQASFRASRFGVGLTDEDRKTLWEDGLFRLSLGGFDYDEVKSQLDIEER
jgi:hypothetical protein